MGPRCVRFMEEKKNNNSYYTALYARIKQVQVPEFDNI